MSLNSTASSFQTLALFICQLFVDGRFRSGQYVYDPKVIDDHLPTQIDSICPDHIPWHKTDITQPFLLPWNRTKQTDHILQLIFFDPNRLAEEIERFKAHFSVYRIFVFPATDDEIERRQRDLLIADQSLRVGTSALILHYNNGDYSLDVDWIPKNDDITGPSEMRMSVDRTAVLLRNQPIKMNHVNNAFDSTFGQFERMHAMTIRFCAVGENSKSISTRAPQLFYANYYLTTLKPSYINVTQISLSNYTAKGSIALKPRPQKYYQEISQKYDLIDNDKS